MKRLPPRSIGYLVATAGSRGRNDDLPGRLANGWEEALLPYLHAHLIMFFFISEGTCHPAAARSNNGHLKILHDVQHGKGVLNVGHGFLMTMAMQLDLLFFCTEGGTANISGEDLLFYA